MENVVIIGSGPAAWSAATYTARADLSPLVLASGIAPGGALMTTTDVDNFPGFHEGIQGPDLMDAMQKQAERFGARVQYADAKSIAKTVAGFELATADEVIEAKAVIYATGSEHRKLGVPGEDDLAGMGVSYCATCDGAFFRNEHVIVVGGGDSAMEEAVFLSKFASKVTIFVRGGELRASKATIAQAEAIEHIEFSFHTSVVELVGDNGLEVVRAVKAGEPVDFEAAGLFVAIGSDPRTHLVHELVELTPRGVIAVEGRSSKTKTPGLFAAGDVIDADYKQAGIAAASGIVAALDVEKYLQ